MRSVSYRSREMLEEAFRRRYYGAAFNFHFQFAEWANLKPHLSKLTARNLVFVWQHQQKQREEMIDRFQHDPQGPPIMILSPKLVV